MNSNILVSIIIPVYNAEKFISTAIESILRQNADWIEVVLVNDGSRDSSLKICEKYQSDSVKLITTENLGAGHARNVGINNASGKWIMFLDSDDLILSGFFCDDLKIKLGGYLNKGIDIIYTPKIVCDYELKNNPAITYPEPVESIENHIPSIEFWSSVYSAEYLKNNGISFFEYQKQDIESAFRFRAFSRARNIFVDNKMIFYVHRDNPASNVNTWSLDNLYEIKSKVFHELFIEYDNSNYNISDWLYIQSLYFAKALLIHCKKYGFTENSELQIQSVLNQYFDNEDTLKFRLSLKYRILNIFLKKLSRQSLLWKLYCQRCSRNKREEQNKIAADLPEDNTAELLERLDLYSTVVEHSKEGAQYE